MTSDGNLLVINHLLHKFVMLLRGFHKGCRFGIPFLSTLHQHERVLHHVFWGVGWMNGVWINRPWPVHLSSEASCFDGGIAVRPLFCLRERIGDQDEDAAQGCVIHEWTGND